MAMERENRPARGAGKRRKKVCQFCVDKCECIDYKDAAKLRRFISERSKILPRRTKKTCRKAGLFLRPDRPFSPIYHALSPM